MLASHSTVSSDSITKSRCLAAGESDKCAQGTSRLCQDQPPPSILIEPTWLLCGPQTASCRPAAVFLLQGWVTAGKDMLPGGPLATYSTARCVLQLPPKQVWWCWPKPIDWSQEADTRWLHVSQVRPLDVPVNDALPRYSWTLLWLTHSTSNPFLLSHAPKHSLSITRRPPSLPLNHHDTFSNLGLCGPAALLQQLPSPEASSSPSRQLLPPPISSQDQTSFSLPHWARILDETGSVSPNLPPLGCISLPLNTSCYVRLSSSILCTTGARKPWVLWGISSSWITLSPNSLYFLLNLALPQVW